MIETTVHHHTLTMTKEEDKLRGGEDQLREKKERQRKTMRLKDELEC